jgi:hypothetical protein
VAACGCCSAVALAALTTEVAPPTDVLELAQHRRAAVVSAWTRSGARVLVRPMPEARGLAAVTLTMMGGELLENANTRGVTRLLAEAWEDELEAAATQTSGQLRSAAVRVSAVPDGVQVRISGSPADVERAVNVVRVALAVPTLDRAAVERAQRLVLEEIQSLARSGRGALGAAVMWASRQARTASKVRASTLARSIGRTRASPAGNTASTSAAPSAPRPLRARD